MDEFFENLLKDIRQIIDSYKNDDCSDFKNLLYLDSKLTTFIQDLYDYRDYILNVRYVVCKGKGDYSE